MGLNFGEEGNEPNMKSDPNLAVMETDYNTYSIGKLTIFINK